MEKFSYRLDTITASHTTRSRRWNSFKSGAPEWFKVSYLGNPGIYIYGVDKIVDEGGTTSPSATLSVIRSFQFQTGTTTPNWSVFSRNRQKLVPRAIKPGYLAAYPVPRWNPPKFKFRKKPLLENYPNKVHFLRSLKQWVIYDSRRQNAFIAYRLRFLKLTERYNKRLETVRLRREKLKRLSLQSRKAGTGFVPDNPYTKLEVVWDKNSTPSFSYIWDIGANPYLWQYKELSSVYTTANGLNFARRAPAGLLDFFSPEIDQMKSRLTKKFFEKLANQKVHLGNIIAERRQTATMALDTVQSIKRLLLSKRALFELAAHFRPKEIADKFLAFKFGLEPLVNDLDSSLEILANTGVGPDRDTIIIRTNTKRFVSLNRSGTSFNGLMEVSMVVKYHLPSPVSKTLQELGLVNPSEILWEVMPWSFVVDWFLPIGKFLSSLSAEVGVEFATGTFSTRIIGQLKSSTPVVYSHAVDEQVSIMSEASLPLGNCSIKLYDRSVLSNSPVLELPSFKSPLSLTHGLEALALSVQRLRRK